MVAEVYQIGYSRPPESSVFGYNLLMTPAVNVRHEVGLELAQRLLHRGAPDAERPRELALGRQDVAAADQPQPDVAPDLLGDDLVGARRIDALELDVAHGA